MKCIIREMIRIALVGLLETIVILIAIAVVIGVLVLVAYGIDTSLVVCFGQTVRDAFISIAMVVGMLTCIVGMCVDLYKKAKVNCVTKGE